MATWHGYILIEINAAFADRVRKLITILKRAEDVGDYPPTFLPLQVRWSNRAVWEAEGV